MMNRNQSNSINVIIIHKGQSSVESNRYAKKGEEKRGKAGGRREGEGEGKGKEGEGKGKGTGRKERRGREEKFGWDNFTQRRMSGLKRHDVLLA